MRAWKAALALTAVFALGQYVRLYYKSVQFDDFVQREAQRNHLASQLTLTLLDKAQEFSLPVRDTDINITNIDGVRRVGVDYRAPLNLFLYTPSLKFRALGAGFVNE